MIHQEVTDSDADVSHEGHLSEYIERLEASAKHFITKFFANKDFHCGGPIPQNRLLSRSSLNIVLSTDFCKGVQECYRVMPKTTPPPDFDIRWYSWDVDCFLPIFASVRAVGIPKEFQAGMMLLYYKFCEGCKVEEKAFDISHIIT